MAQTQRAYVVYPAVFDENTIAAGSGYLNAVINEIQKGDGSGDGKVARGSATRPFYYSDCHCDTHQAWKIACIVIGSLFGLVVLVVFGWVMKQILWERIQVPNPGRGRSQERDEANNAQQGLALENILGSG
ncbi:hypothetical protein PG993_003233 [Apiospora rasikravindrae]|uniref:Uncharacterized protein n=1 Tax=Apiospora rasikravindrae TaxID=990691 RepID=A0ABR1TZ31_9PEZI